MLGKFLLGSAVLGALLLAPVVSHAEDEGSVNIKAEDDITILSNEYSGKILNYSNDSGEKRLQNAEDIAITEEEINETLARIDSGEITPEELGVDILSDGSGTSTVRWWAYLDLESDHNNSISGMNAITYSHTVRGGVIREADVLNATITNGNPLTNFAFSEGVGNISGSGQSISLEASGTTTLGFNLGGNPAGYPWATTIRQTVIIEDFDGEAGTNPVNPPPHWFE